MSPEVLVVVGLVGGLAGWCVVYKFIKYMHTISYVHNTSTLTVYESTSGYFIRHQVGNTPYVTHSDISYAEAALRHYAKLEAKGVLAEVSTTELYRLERVLGGDFD